TDVEKASTDHAAVVTVSSIDNPQPVTISGDASARFQIGESMYDAQSTDAVIGNGESLVILLDAADAFSATTYATVTVGEGADAVSVTFNVTTEAEDNLPDTMNFGDFTDVEVETVVESNVVTLAGLNTSVTAALAADSD